MKSTRLDNIIASFHSEVSKLAHVPKPRLNNRPPTLIPSVEPQLHIFKANVLSDPYGSISSGDDSISSTVSSIGSALSSQIGDVFGSFDPNLVLSSSLDSCSDCVGVTLPDSISFSGSSESGDGPFDPLGGITRDIGNAVGDVWSGVQQVSSAIGTAENFVTGPISDLAGEAVTDLTGSSEVGALAQAATEDFATRALEDAVCPECAVGFAVVGAVNTFSDDISKGDSPIQAAGDAALDVVTGGFGNVVTTAASFLGFRRKLESTSVNMKDSFVSLSATQKGLLISYNTTYSLELFKLVSGGKINTTLALQQHISKLHRNTTLMQSTFKAAAKRLITSGYVNSEGRVVLSSNSVVHSLAEGSLQVTSSGVKKTFQSVLSAVPVLNLNHVNGQFEANFDPNETGGASGAFSMLITASGRASYRWSIDLTNFKSFDAYCNSSVIAKYGLKCKLFQMHYTYFNLLIVTIF